MIFMYTYFIPIFGKVLSVQMYTIFLIEQLIEREIRVNASHRLNTVFRVRVKAKEKIRKSTCWKTGITKLFIL